MKKFLLLIFLLAPVSTFAMESAPFEISGWLPYWRVASGTDQVLSNLDKFTEIDPFGYSIRSDGTLYDLAKLTEAPWQDLSKGIGTKPIRLIPSIMSSDGKAVYRILGDPSLRARHVRAIRDMVVDGNYDGVDLDYENGIEATKQFFPLFLNELKQALADDKWLMCTVQVHEFLTPEAGAEVNKWAQYCDRVRIMTYDQSFVDKKFLPVTNTPYVPVADIAWVEKIITNAMRVIPKNKIMIGIPTYGYEFEVTPLAQGYVYKKLWAFNPRYATDLAKELGRDPTRNVAGELSLSYTTLKKKTEPLAAVLAPTGVPLNVLWWSDAGAIEDKFRLARKLGVRGVSIFKLDGAADPGLMSILDKYKS